MSKRKRSRAVKVGCGASAATGGAMIGATAALSGPVANLGGYAVAQMVAGSVGLGGPALSVGIAAIGGPVVVGGAAAVAVGCAAYALVSWIAD